MRTSWQIETSSGKSYLAGLLAERLVQLGYVVIVFDTEGDHAALGGLRGVLTIGSGATAPDPEQLGRLVQHRFSSLVIDMSLLSDSEKKTYYLRAMKELERLRTATGLPHWIFLEEAHQLLRDSPLPQEEVGLPPQGFCLVTYQPRDLPPQVLDDVDLVLALRGAETFARVPSSRVGGELAPTSNDGVGPSPAPDVFGLEPGFALLGDRSGTQRFRIADRCSEHVRHWHKYLEGELPAQRHFFFRNGRGPTGRAAANLVQFHRELRAAPAGVVAHHLSECDFSNWLRDVIGDDYLASRIREIERWYQTEHAAHIDVARRAVIHSIEERYREPGDGFEFEDQSSVLSQV